MLLENLELPELTDNQARILTNIIKRRICSRLFYQGSSFELKKEALWRMDTRNASREDVAFCLLTGKYGGHLRRGEKTNEVTFRMIGQDLQAAPLCVVLAVNIVNSRCHDSWIIKVVTTFMDNITETDEQCSSVSVFNLFFLCFPQ